MKFQHALHRKLWLWLADNPDKRKYHWPKWRCNGGTVEVPVNECFACEATGHSTGRCNCVLLWPDNDRPNANDCMGELGLFRKWEWEDHCDTRANLARTIAELPVREGVECI